MTGIPRAASSRLLAALALAGSWAAAPASAVTKPASAYRALDLFARLLHFVESNYVEKVPPKKLIYGAIRGLMGALDPHTSFLSPEMYREMKIDTSGEFGGLGIEVSVKRGQLVIVSPIEGTPAERAGIRPGDRIVAIDGKPTRAMTLHEAVRKMRGPKGTKVKLTIARAGEKKPLEFVLVRDRIRVKSASGAMLEPGYAYIRLKTFQERTARYLSEVLGRLERENKGPLRGLLLDLRNNPGGLLDQAVRVADLFLPGGLIIVTTKGRGRYQVERRFARSKPKSIAPYPMVVLVNGGSASASEIVAGALQDHRRAVVLGTQTFGKGSVQSVIELEDGEGNKVGLKLTVAKYYTPKGRSIQEHGIAPDIVVHEGTVPASAPRARRRERDLQRHFRAESTAPATKPKIPPGLQKLLSDQQVRTALDHLKAFHILRATAGSR